MLPHSHQINNTNRHTERRWTNDNFQFLCFSVSWVHVPLPTSSPYSTRAAPALLESNSAWPYPGLKHYPPKLEMLIEADIESPCVSSDPLLYLFLRRGDYCENYPIKYLCRYKPTKSQRSVKSTYSNSQSMAVTYEYHKMFTMKLFTKTLLCLSKYH